MNCSQCGHQNPDTHRFCAMCGSPLNRSSEFAPPRSVEDDPIARDARATDFDRDPTDPGRVLRHTDPSVPLEEPAEEFSSPEASPSYDRASEPSAFEEPPDVAATPVTGAATREPYTVEPDRQTFEPSEDELRDRVYEREDDRRYSFDQDNRTSPGDFERSDAGPGDTIYDRDDTDFAPPPRNQYLHGPSLLGLAEDSTTADDTAAGEKTDYSYLYEDEDTGGRSVNWRLIIALVVLVLFGGVIYYLWSQGANWNSTIVKMTKGDQAQKPQPEIVAKSEPPTPGAPEIAVTKNEGPRVGQAGSPADNSAQKPASADAAQPREGQQKNAAAAGSAPPPSEAKSSESKPPDTTATATSKPETKSAEAKSAEAKQPDTKPADAKSEVAKAADAKTAPPLDEEASTGSPDDESAADIPPATGTRKGTPKPTAAKGTKETKKPDADTAAKVRRADSLLRAHNCSQSVALLREAAMQGNATARSRLGGLYATGRCVPLDRAEAYNWFTLAKDAGARYSWIDHNRSMLWAQMDAHERERVARR